MRPNLVHRLVFGTVEGVVMALTAIRSSAGRSLLTVLGVAIGVFVVVVLASAMHGMREGLVADLNAAGLSSFTVYSTEGIPAGACEPKRVCAPPVPLTEGDAHAVADAPDIALVAAVGGSSTTDVYRNRTLPEIRLSAVEAPWFELGGGRVVTGRPFTREEDHSDARVVVVDTTLAHLLFDAQDPLGRTITLDGVPMRVIGTYVAHASAERMMMMGVGDIPATLLASAAVPLRTAQRYFGAGVAELTVRPRAGVSREQGIAVTTAVLRAAHRLGPRSPNDFEIENPGRELALLEDQTRTLRIGLLAFSSVGLFVGGVGVIAIMLVSVTERTREIGLRKALGARRVLIAWQFLVEAATMTALGAVTGLAAGLAGVALLRSFTAIPATAPMGAVVVALAVSVVVGLVFGLLPALRAAKLDPVDALRYE